MSIFLDQDDDLNDRTQAVLNSPDVQLVLPTFVGIETVGTPSMRNGSNIAPVSNRYIDSAKEYFDSCGALWVEVNRRVMLRAQDYCNRYLLKPPDATILASAVEAECDFLYTHDAQLIKNAQGIDHITVAEPPPLPPPEPVQTRIDLC
ncbi:hypothetical protein M3G14_04655 [Corynebacterium sp. p3-SID1056]|nr:hypothetical protein [Corynebacterium sp. p3-SID1056]